MTEVQISLVEQPTANSVDVMKWLESYPSSTNKPTKELRSVCDVIWVNSNLDDWLASVSTNHHPTVTAMGARYRFGGKNCFIGIRFNGEPVQQAGPPDSGFTKLDLTGMKEGAQ